MKVKSESEVAQSSGESSVWPIGSVQSILVFESKGPRAN